METKFKSAKKPLIVCSIIVVALLVILAVSLLTAPQTTENNNSQQQQPAVDNTTEISLLAVGDDLIHGPIYRQAKARANNNGYDFSYAYQNIVPYLKGYDFKLINQETPLGGEALGLSSYPRFNSPTQLGDYLTSIGFNLVSHANNHVLDAGEQGLMNTINYWKTKTGVTMAGIYNNQAAADQIQIVQKDGVKIAFLAYTYGTNGLSLPADSTAVINYINQDKMKAQIAKAETQADITLVMMHWGVEYQKEPNAEQKALAQMMANAGVDIIIGSHPHVIQQVATLPQTNGGKCVCFYSLGNFISAQDDPATMLGGMASIKLDYDQDKHQINFKKVEFIPIVNQFNSGYANIHIVPLADYTDQLASEHGVSGLSVNYFTNLVKTTVNKKYINIR